MRNADDGEPAVALAPAPVLSKPKMRALPAKKAHRKEAPPEVYIASTPAKKPFKPSKVAFKDESTGTVFYVTGPLAPVFKAQRLGLGLTVKRVAELADVCETTVYRRETDTNLKGSWGWLRTNVHILNALGLQVMGVSGA